MQSAKILHCATLLAAKMKYYPRQLSRLSYMEREFAFNKKLQLLLQCISISLFESEPLKM